MYDSARVGGASARTSSSVMRNRTVKSTPQSLAVCAREKLARVVDGRRARAMRSFVAPFAPAPILEPLETSPGHRHRLGVDDQTETRRRLSRLWRFAGKKSRHRAVSRASSSSSSSTRAPASSTNVFPPLVIRKLFCGHRINASHARSTASSSPNKSIGQSARAISTRRSRLVFNR